MIDIFGLKIGKAEPVIDEEKIIDGEEADEVGPDLEDEGDDDPEENEARHNHQVAVFLFLKANTLHRIGVLTDHLADERLDTQQWAKAFREEMTGAHSEAWMIGRRLAGDVQAIGQRDITGGSEAWTRQEDFFAKFVRDLEEGRYTNPDGSLNEKAFNARARSYGAGIRGTATDSFKTAMGQDVLAWILGDADHCKPSKDFPFYCVGLSEEAPKPADEWPTAPGFCDTPCLNNCTCDLSSEDGKFSTKGI